MINKAYELKKIDLKKNKFFLIHGNNDGHKRQVLEINFKAFFTESIYNYEEAEILTNKENFYNDILSKSFFEDEKLIIISRVTDKILEVIENIIEKKVDDIVIVLNSAALEKKSKLRSLFEKNKETICVPFYEDDHQTLMSIVNGYFRENKIRISQQSINLIVKRSRGDRQNLENELSKVGSFAKNRVRVEIEDILKLTNLAENYSVSELIDSCLAKNLKKTINILNENNYSLEDCILIIRTFLIKSKRLLNLSYQLKNKKNIDGVVSTFKPPIFWKDKEIVKEQLKRWSYKNVENLIFKINETEFLIKKNSLNSINILSDFIIEQAIITNN
jgi:DNA polymerase-3 subunit delta